MEYGEKLYTEVVQNVLSRRTQAERYTVYITDMDLTHTIAHPESSGMQTVHYLNYKKDS